MLSWNVYDTHYGIPISYEQELASGRHVIANVSRTVVGPGVEDFAPARVIQITAPREVLEARLMTRAENRVCAIPSMRKASAAMWKACPPMQDSFWR